MPRQPRVTSRSPPLTASTTIPPALPRQLQLLALDHIWTTSCPRQGSPRSEFDRALLELERFARQRLAVPLATFERWASALVFDVGDKDCPP